MKAKHFALTVAVFSLALAAQPALARDQIRVVGSSTVFPFVTAAAEQFGQMGGFKTPVVESTGTGGGFKLFCAGAGDDTPDISDASRPITSAEQELCRKNGVSGITEITLGYDGIVIAQKKGQPLFSLTRKQLFLALARQVPKDGKLVNNPAMQWKDVDPSLPAIAISVYGPPPTSGTRDAFVELAMNDGCKEVADIAKVAPSDDDKKKVCGQLREDGKYVEAGEDDNLVIQKLVADQNALGIFGYSYLEENAGKVQAVKVEGMAPSFDAISKADYKLSRSLFIYVKNDHVGKVPGIAEFAQQVVSDAASGPDGYLTGKGLIPLPDAMRAQMQARAAQLGKAGSH
jgi:phosphate transport system substrate-binding protein